MELLTLCWSDGNANISRRTNDQPYMILLLFRSIQLGYRIVEYQRRMRYYKLQRFGITSVSFLCCIVVSITGEMTNYSVHNFAGADSIDSI